MNLIKLKSTEGVDIFVNPEQVAIISPNGDIIGQAKVVFVNGLVLAAFENVRDLAGRLGWKESLEL